MRRNRTPFFVLALLILLSVILIERSTVQASQVAARLASFISGSSPVSLEQGLQVFTPEQQRTLDKLRSQKANEISRLKGGSLSGFGVRSLQYVDGLLLFGIVLIALTLFLPRFIRRYEYYHARLQGLVTLIFDIFIILAGVSLLLQALVKLLLMIALLLSFPFGTLAYLAIYGDFPRAAMIAVLSTIFFLKLLFGLLMLLAHQDFIKNLGLVLYVLGSFIANLIVTLLYTIVPGILASITDAIAAIVVVIVGIILAAVMIVFAVQSLILALKPGLGIITLPHNQP